MSNTALHTLIVLCFALSCTPAEPANFGGSAGSTPPGAATLDDDDPPGAEQPPVPEDPSTPGWLGVELRAVPAGEVGVEVRAVVRGSPAAHVGLEPGDRIVSVAGQPVAAPGDVVRLVSGHHAGARVSLAVARGSTKRLFAATLAAAPDQDEVMRLRYVGEAAPPLRELLAVQGSSGATLSELRGRVVLLEFWASWCVVCRLIVPKMNEWHDRYAMQGVSVLGVTAESVSSASLSAAQLGITHPVLADPTGKTTEAYRAMALPTLFVLDKRGVVRDVVVGYDGARYAQVEALISTMLAEN